MKNRILHVEDDRMVRALMDEALHFLGYEVIGEANGVAALARLARERFDVVVTDHNMPEGGGLDLVRALRARGFGGRVYVLSGALPPAARREYELLAVDGIAAKPLGLMELSQFLKRGMVASQAAAI